MGRADSGAASSREVARLRERVRLLEDAIEHMSHGVCMFTPDARIALSNRRYAEVIGQPADNIREGMNLRELVELAIAAGHREADADSAELEATLWANAHLEPDARSRLERGGRSYDVKTGTTADGYVVVTFENVTAKLEAEKALRASEARLRAILDAMPDCVKIFDEDGQLIYINPCGLELLEAPSFEILNASRHVSVPANISQTASTFTVA